MIMIGKKIKGVVNAESRLQSRSANQFESLKLYTIFSKVNHHGIIHDIGNTAFHTALSLSRMKWPVLDSAREKFHSPSEMRILYHAAALIALILDAMFVCFPYRISGSDRLGYFMSTNKPAEGPLDHGYISKTKSG